MVKDQGVIIATWVQTLIFWTFIYRDSSHSHNERGIRLCSIVGMYNEFLVMSMYVLYVKGQSYATAISHIGTFFAAPIASVKGLTVHVLPESSNTKQSLPNTHMLAWESSSVRVSS